MSDLVAELRTLADRLEDGEYAVTEIEISNPSVGEYGEFRLELQTEEDFERMNQIMDSANLYFQDA